MLIVSILGMLAILALAVYFASKGYPVKVGLPFFKAEINY